jgi:hypothetical protein
MRRFIVMRYRVFGTNDAPRPAGGRESWHGGRMGRTSLSRTIAAVLAGAALFLTAGSCGGGEDEDGDDAPGVTQQEDGDGEGDD